MFLHTMYTVVRCKKDDTLYGDSHGSTDCESTVCGKSLNENWWVIDNVFEGEINCGDCLKILKGGMNDKRRN